MEFTLLWAVLTAVAFAWIGLRVWPGHVPARAFDRFVGATVTGLVIGRLTAMVAAGINPIANPLDMIVVRGGVSTPAATVGFMVTLAWMTRSDRRALDALAPAALLGLAGWHLGCLWRGACLGAATDLPWGWALQGSDISRHPVEIYAAIALGAAAWLVSEMGWRRWQRAGTGLAAASGIRLLNEPLRPTLGGGPIGWYVAGMVAGVIVMVVGHARDSARPRTPT